MDGWKTILSFWDGLFSKLLLLFLGRVVFTACKVHVSSCEFSKVYTSHVAAKNDTLPKFNIFTPENWWLEYDPFLLGFGNSSGASC